MQWEYASFLLPLFHYTTNCFRGLVFFVCCCFLLVGAFFFVIVVLHLLLQVAVLWFCRSETQTYGCEHW